jgi:hypothetical protein
MFSPVLAASYEPVLGASTNRAVLYLFLSFFHTYHITAQVLFEVDVREAGYFHICMNHLRGISYCYSLPYVDDMESKELACSSKVFLLKVCSIRREVYFKRNTFVKLQSSMRIRLITDMTISIHIDVTWLMKKCSYS